MSNGVGYCIGYASLIVGFIREASIATINLEIILCKNFQSLRKKVMVLILILGLIGS